MLKTPPSAKVAAPKSSPPLGWGKNLKLGTPGTKNVPSAVTAPATTAPVAAQPIQSSPAYAWGLAAPSKPANGKGVAAPAPAVPKPWGTRAKAAAVDASAFLPQAGHKEGAPGVPATRVPQPRGLSAFAVADLARSGISPEQAKELGMYSTENAQVELGYVELRAVPGLVIPYFQPDGEPVTFDRDGETLPFGRVRYLEQPAQKLGFTGPKEMERYGQPARSGVRVYFPRCVPWMDVATDPKAAILICEGEKKTAVAAVQGR